MYYCFLSNVWAVSPLSSISLYRNHILVTIPTSPTHEQGYHLSVCYYCRCLPLPIKSYRHDIDESDYKHQLPYPCCQDNF